MTVMITIESIFYWQSKYTQFIEISIFVACVCVSLTHTHTQLNLSRSNLWCIESASFFGFAVLKHHSNSIHSTQFIRCERVCVYFVLQNCFIAVNVTVYCEIWRWNELRFGQSTNTHIYIHDDVFKLLVSAINTIAMVFDLFSYCSYCWCCCFWERIRERERRTGESNLQIRINENNCTRFYGKKVAQYTNVIELLANSSYGEWTWMKLNFSKTAIQLKCMRS